MSQNIELPDPIFLALQKAAEKDGLTTVEWIAEQLPEGNGTSPDDRSPPSTEAASLADLFAGRTGRIASGGRERLSEQEGDAFSDYLEAKRRAGHL